MFKQSSYNVGIKVLRDYYLTLPARNRLRQSCDGMKCLTIWSNYKCITILVRVLSFIELLQFSEAAN